MMTSSHRPACEQHGGAGVLDQQQQLQPAPSTTRQPRLPYSLAFMLTCMREQVTQAKHAGQHTGVSVNVLGLLHLVHTELVADVQVTAALRHAGG